MKRIILFIIFFCVGKALLAQNTHFTTSGTIEFEKSVNMFALIKKNITKDNADYMQPLYDQYIKTKPQFKKMKSILTFSKDKSIFKPVEEDTPVNDMYGNDPRVTQNNIIFTDLLNNTSITQKNIFEEKLLVKDSTRKITWKITDETRDIAGYTCRRANALIMDSVYVVAFYTDEIAVTGGPESFTGLPGMILGIALPHDNITWFATKVTDMAVPPATIIPPTKGKSVNHQQLQTTLQDALKQYGTEVTGVYFKVFLL